ncbi:MAG: hypothetical protein LH609_08135 [Rudanella sp.]|nr:hypothetical protein [Rudanella sp.]
MQRRHSPLGRTDSILLYGFGLALTLSLVFNGFMLVEQNHRANRYDYEIGSSVNPVEHGVWQQQLSECQQANQLKDSVIRHLEKVSNAPPGGRANGQHSASN